MCASSAARPKDQKFFASFFKKEDLAFAGPAFTRLP
jgi:hypothetical protein